MVFAFFHYLERIIFIYLFIYLHNHYVMSTWESRDKMTKSASPMARHKKYYKEEGGDFPQV
jgi:hypothetical protein